MNIMITGSSGFIGSILCDCIRNTTSSNLLIPDEYELDILDGKKVEEYICDNKPDIVIHLAGQSYILKSHEDPFNDAEINIGGTLNIISACEKIKENLKKIIYSSTMSIYGEGDDHSETVLPQPTSPYAISKVTGEYYIRLSSVPHTIFRFANVYGFGADPPRVVNKFISLIKEGIPITVYEGDDLSARDYIYIDDVIKAIIMMINNDYFGTFNLCTGIPISILDLWNSICQVYDKEVIPLYDFNNTKSGELIRSVGCPDKLEKVTGFKIENSLLEGLKKIKEIDNAING